MALPVRRAYKGAPASTTLSAGINASATNVSVASVTGWPTSFPFFAVIDPGTSKEEKVRVTNISTLVLTVVRGVDDTVGAAHDAAAAIYPVFTATEADEANQIASVMTTKGDLISTDGSSINRLAVGATNAHVLQVDSAQTNGIKWGQVATAGIADSAVTSAKIADRTVVADDIALATLKLICPVGTIAPYGGTSAPTGWLLCDGGSISASYTELRALVGTTTPNFKGRTLVGLDGTQTEFDAIFETGGVKTVTLTAAQSGLPAHLHSVSITSGPESASHTHSITFTETPSGTLTTVLPSAGSGIIAQASNQTSGTTNANSVGHDHLVSGTTANVAAANASEAHSNLQPYAVVTYIIKHDY
jgi:microcystin-dependent protein